MVTNNFIFYLDWMNGINMLPIDKQDKVLADIVRYGVGADLVYGDDPEIASYVEMVKKSIDLSKKSYEAKIKGGEVPKAKRRPKIINDDVVEELANRGYRAQEIADQLGCSKSAIDHSEGWKRRKK